MEEQTPIETMIEKWLFIKFGMGGATEDNLTPSEWVEFAQWLSQAKVLEALERDEKEYPKIYWEAKQVIEDDKQSYHPSDRINAYGYIRGFEHAIEFLKNTTKQK